jgi:PIN domain nuclease of toxin-antitoxin system
VLADTHALLWWAIGDSRLSRRAKTVLSGLETEVLVSAASAWEVCTKVRLGKLPGAEMFALDFAARVRRMGFHELPVNVEHGQRAGLLPGDHRDPFDRVLIAQSLAENLPVVSNEKLFENYGVQRIW